MRPVWLSAVLLVLAAGTASAADVAVDATGSPGISAGAGYVDVRIDSPGTAQNVVLTVALQSPATFSFVFRPLIGSAPECVTPAPGQSGSVVCTHPTFPGAAVYRVGFNVPQTLPEGATVTITASVSTTSPDDLPSNNSDSVTIAVVAAFTDVTVAKRLVSTEPIGGGTARLTFEATATNVGPYTARDVVLTDINPQGLVTQSYTCANSVRDTGCCLVLCRGDLPAGQAMTLTYVATAEERFLPLLRNTARVTSTADPNPANDEAVAAAAATIPALGDWSMFLFVAGLAAAGLLLLRRGAP